MKITRGRYETAVDTAKALLTETLHGKPPLETTMELAFVLKTLHDLGGTRLLLNHAWLDQADVGMGNAPHAGIDN